MIALDSSRWTELRHAYGFAADIPLLLRSIADNPGVSSSVDGPWFKLWSALCHQGDVYPASFAAVPHIIQTLSGNLDKACFDFFLLPASIEVARHKREMPVPESLRAAYQQS